jgi:hypothetical protein
MRSRIAAVLVLGLVLATGLASAHRAGMARSLALHAADVGTFSLVNRVCDKGQEQIGRGCWDRPYLTTWAVHDGTATWTETTFNATYTWSVPQQVPPAGADVSMGVQANDVSNNSGIDVRICVLQGYTQFQVKGGDQCAEAYAMTPGSSKSASKTATLLTTGTPVNQDCPGGGFGCVTLMISLGDGGNVYYTYRASASQLTTVQYSFLGVYSKKNVGAVTSLRLQGLGSFDFNGPPGKHKVEGMHLAGSAIVELHFRAHPAVLHSARLVPTRIRYHAPNQVDITYRVTSSDIFCVKEHRQERISIAEFRRGGDHIGFDFCTSVPTKFKQRSVLAVIKSS